MLKIITPNGTDHSKTRKLISKGTIIRGDVWSKTPALLVSVLDTDFGRYYKATVTDQAGGLEEDQLSILEYALAKPLTDCVVKVVHHDRPNKLFPGSKSFDVVTIYAE